MQVPAKPNYNLVMYYAAEKPVNKESLLGRFIDGTDAFRDARFKLIPSIVEVVMYIITLHLTIFLSNSVSLFLHVNSLRK